MLWLIAIAALFLQMGYMPLSADEPIRAIVAYNMELTGEFIVPYVNGEVYLNKPPMYNWILLAFFALFGSHEEWVIRMPAVLSILIFGIYLYRVIKTETENRQLGFLTAMAFITTGNLLFYSSYLGHIDVTYSLVVFGSFVAVYRGVKYEDWLNMFMLSYFLCWVGFMMKGLPSVVFIALTIGPWLIIKKQWKMLFSIEHFVGIATFLTLLSAYFVMYKGKEPVMPFFERLWNESSQRTITDKHFLESLRHLYEFPLKFLVDMAPWGLILLLLPFRRFRRFTLKSEWNRFALTILLFNIIIYWLSPDYRARYVFMLMPLFLTVMIAPLTSGGGYIKLSKTIGFVSDLLIFLIILYGVYLFIQDGNSGMAVAAGFGFVWILSALLYRSDPFIGWKSLIALLLIARIGYSYTVIPERVAKSEYINEKEQAIEIATITEGSSLAMYHSNVNLTMNWYIAHHRMEPLVTKLDGDDFFYDEYYLVPADVLTDSTNYESYYSFVRRYLHKPFELVKFKKYFPPMPKANNDAKDITGNSSNE